MTEVIDEFKYQVYLAKLEQLKSKGKTKKPIADFIKELHKLSNELLYYNELCDSQLKTLMYSFMLCTKALKYYDAKTLIPKSLIDDLNFTPQRLFDKRIITADNINTVFEFYTDKLTIRITDFAKVEYLNEVLQNYTNPNLRIIPAVYELSTLADDQTIMYLYLTTVFPNSAILKFFKYSIDENKINKALKNIEKATNILNLILKEHHELNSTNSTKLN